MAKDKKKFWELDFSIPLIVTAIAAFSLIAIAVTQASPFTGEEHTLLEYIDKLNFYYVRLQFVWYALGMVMMAVVIWVDYTKYKDFVGIAYWGSVVLLFLVLFFAPEQRGMTGRFKILNYNFQPSEMAKLTVILYLAKRISSYENGIQTVRQLMTVLFYAAIPLFLILLQPDFGTALVFLVAIAGMLVLGGTNHKILLGLVGVGAVSIPAAWFLVIRNVPYMYNRVMDFLNPSRDVTGLGSNYQVTQSQIAIGSGQLTGKGLFSAGSMSQLSFVPDQLTDFIFSAVGETFGFIGGITLIGLYMLLIFRLLWMSFHTNDRYGSLIITGVLFMLMFHIFESIAMTMGLMPVTGIPLPFMSYGGSSMWTNMLSLGLVGSVWWRRGRFRADKTGKTLEFSPERTV